MQIFTTILRKNTRNFTSIIRQHHVSSISRNRTITKADISLTQTERRTCPVLISIPNTWQRASVSPIRIKQIKSWISIRLMEESSLRNMIRDSLVPTKTFIRIIMENLSRKKWASQHANTGMSFSSETFRTSKNLRSLISNETKYVMSVTSSNRSAALRKRPINHEYILLSSIYAFLLILTIYNTLIHSMQDIGLKGPSD